MSVPGRGTSSICQGTELTGVLDIEEGRLVKSQAGVQGTGTPCRTPWAP